MFLIDDNNEIDMMNFEAEILSKLDCSEIINKHIYYTNI